jgi:hypothetical protein
LPFTHGIEVENFITDRRGDILEDGKELVAVWDQMFNGAYQYLKNLLSAKTPVPSSIRRKIKRIKQKDVERHGKFIRYVQLDYHLNGKVVTINIFGPDPNISQITWLLELVTPPCESLAELDWWVKTLYLAATQSITKGYHIQPLGFNPFQTEYRAGVTCGEHHHLGSFRTDSERKAAYNMIRAYIPHLIAITNTSPIVDGKPTGRTIRKKGSDGRTLILSPDSIKSYRLKQNSGQLGPNIPEYLPHLHSRSTQNQFSRHVRKEIPDDRYVDVSPFTAYDTIECRFFDTQYDQNIRRLIVILLQALALKGVKLKRANQDLPEIKGNDLFEHRKRAIQYGLFAKFQGDPQIESSRHEFVKYYNHNPLTGGNPGKIFESLQSMLLWLEPELEELNISEQEIRPLLIMLWGTSSIAPPISPATFIFYLYEENRRNISSVIRKLGLHHGYPQTIFSDVLGRPQKQLSEILSKKVAQPHKTTDHSNTSLAKKLQRDSNLRRKKAMMKAKQRLKAKKAREEKIRLERLRRKRALEKKRKEQLARIKRKAKKRKTKTSRTKKPTPIKTSSSRSKSKRRSSSSRKKKIKPVKSTRSKSRSRSKKTKTKPKVSRVKSSKSSRSSRSRKPSRKKKVITNTAIRRYNNKRSSSSSKAKSYASTVQKSKRQKVKTRRKKSRSKLKKSRQSVKGIVKDHKGAIPGLKDKLEFDFFTHPNFVRKVSIKNIPSEMTHHRIVPMIKINWKRSKLRSLHSLPVSIETTITPLKNSRKKSINHDSYNIEQPTLQKKCYLPVPLSLKGLFGEIHLKFIIRDANKKVVLATAHTSCIRKKVYKKDNHLFKKLEIPPHQVGKTKVTIAVRQAKKRRRSKIKIWALSQRGKIKLKELKKRFKRRTAKVKVPISIPLSICASTWYLFVEYNAARIKTTEWVKVTPPIKKTVSLRMSARPPLPSEISPDYSTEITPEITFKARTAIKKLEIFQRVDDKKISKIKKYKLKSRFKNGQKVKLESFSWEPPSMREWLFWTYDQRHVEFYYVIYDKYGVVNHSLTDLQGQTSLMVRK